MHTPCLKVYPYESRYPPQKMYVILRWGFGVKLEAKTSEEHSGWLQYSDSVCRVWLEPPINIVNPNKGEFIARVNSAKCPIEVDTSKAVGHTNSLFNFRVKSKRRVC